MQGDVAILIPAAGFARRMRGADKLMELVAGQPVLRHIARAACDVAQTVIVALPQGGFGPTRLAAVEGLAVMPVLVPDAAEGMAASLRAGMAALPEGASGVMILLADLPEIDAADLSAQIDAFRADPAAPILRATAEDGQPGHPVIFPRDLFAELAQVSGDSGAKAVVAAHRNRLRDLPLPGRRAVTDLDTPEDWAAWRAERGT
ncbi:MAG: nucleotidyltransferase family protein [Paracoccaceae bacterium]|nr:nucleotidyltransferase family protein [Paracoccaceae bacterium]